MNRLGIAYNFKGDHSAFAMKLWLGVWYNPLKHEYRADLKHIVKITNEMPELLEGSKLLTIRDIQSKTGILNFIRQESDLAVQLKYDHIQKSTAILGKSHGPKEKLPKSKSIQISQGIAHLIVHFVNTSLKRESDTTRSTVICTDAGDHGVGGFILKDDTPIHEIARPLPPDLQIRDDEDRSDPSRSSTCRELYGLLLAMMTYIKSGEIEPNTNIKWLTDSQPAFFIILTGKAGVKNKMQQALVRAIAETAKFHNLIIEPHWHSRDENLAQLADALSKKSPEDWTLSHEWMCIATTTLFDLNYDHPVIMTHENTTIIMTDTNNLDEKRSRKFLITSTPTLKHQQIRLKIPQKDIFSTSTTGRTFFIEING